MSKEITFEDAFPEDGKDELRKAIKEHADKQSPERKQRNEQLGIQYRLEDGELDVKYSGGEKKKIFLVDIDGTVCDDIPNETPELFATARAYPDAQKTLAEWTAAGHEVHFFTARREEHREVTEKWLNDNGFEYDSLVMNKPRIKDGQEYCWVDNKKVRAVTYLGKFTQLVEKTKTILVFDEPQE